MGFLFAPLYHSSMKQVAAVRKQLGFRTVFNLLGPLCHPMQAKKQIIGVYSKEKAKLMAEALAPLEPEHVLFVCGEDGLDELTITANSYVIELKKDPSIQRHRIMHTQAFYVDRMEIIFRQ